MQRLEKQVKHEEPLKIWGLRDICLIVYIKPLQNQCPVSLPLETEIQ